MDHPTPIPFLGNLIPFEQASETIQKLIKLSFAARQNAYAPYSKFLVGAAVLCKDGEIFQGCNVENASYGLSICAEQTAVVKAVSSGKKDISAIAVVAESNSSIITPCGKCRQFLNEFGTNIDVYCAKTDLKEVFLTNISGLLPYGFNSFNLIRLFFVNVLVEGLMGYLTKMNQVFAMNFYKMELTLSSVLSNNGIAML